MRATFSGCGSGGEGYLALVETPAIIRGLAILRLEEAEILVRNNKPDGAFYLAGYSVELALKAKIAERLGISSLFADRLLETEKFPEPDGLRRLVKTHNVGLLLVLSGLRPAYIQAKATSRTFAKFDQLLLSWSEQLRYRLPGQVSTQDVQDFIHFLGNQNGLLQWIANS